MLKIICQTPALAHLIKRLLTISHIQLLIKAPDQSKVYEKDVLYNPRDLSLLQTFSAVKLMENYHEFPLKKAKLDNVQITQAISNGTDIRSQMR